MRTITFPEGVVDALSRSGPHVRSPPKADIERRLSSLIAHRRSRIHSSQMRSKLCAATAFLAIPGLSGCGPTRTADPCDVLRSPKAGLSVELHGSVVKTPERNYVFRPACSSDRSLDLQLFWAVNARVDAPVQDDTAEVIFVGDGIVSAQLVQIPTSSRWALKASAFKRAVFVR